MKRKSRKNGGDIKGGKERVERSVGVLKKGGVGVGEREVKRRVGLSVLRFVGRRVLTGVL